MHRQLFVSEQPVMHRGQTMAVPWPETEAVSSERDQVGSISRKRSRELVEIEEELAMVESQQRIEASKRCHEELELRKLKLRQEQRRLREANEKRVKLEPI